MIPVPNHFNPVHHDSSNDAVLQYRFAILFFVPITRLHGLPRSFCVWPPFLRRISNIWFSKRVLLLCRMQIRLAARRGTASRWAVIYHDFSNWKHKWLVSRRAGDGDDCDDEVMTGGVSRSCRRTSVISDRSRANVTTDIAKLVQLWRPVTGGGLGEKSLLSHRLPLQTSIDTSK